MRTDNKNQKSDLKAFLSDSFWTIAALVMMNAVAQFVVYPVWAKVYSDEVYGNIIYTMSLVNIFAVSMGVGANYARMSESANRKTCSGDYNLLLLACSTVAILGTYVLVWFSGLNMSNSECLLTAVLACATMWRYYADVEYRLNLNFKGYFCYYLAISIGYLVGIAIFWSTRLWPLALLPGEIAGLLVIAFKGSLFRTKPLVRGADFSENIKTALTLIATNIISNTVFNGDRILLQLMMSGTAVTVYYLASLLGKTMSLVTTPLNSVIIGYLARYKGNVSKAMVHKFVAITLAAVALGTLGTWGASYILIRILYADSYAIVKDYFLIANLAQMFYFITNIVTTVLLRFAKTRCQLVINTVYALSFVVLCTAGAQVFGFDGFCAALLLVNVIRYSIAIVYCYKNVERLEGE